MYMFIDILWLFGILFLLFCTHGLAFMAGRYFFWSQSRKEMQDNCIHPADKIEYVKAIKSYMCMKCGVIFRDAKSV